MARPDAGRGRRGPGLAGHEAPEAFGEWLTSQWDAAAAPGAMAALAGRLRGALTMAAPLLEASPAVSSGLLDRVAALDDEAFLRRLPALREGFDVLSPAARQCFLGALPDASAAARTCAWTTRRSCWPAGRRPTARAGRPRAHFRRWNPCDAHWATLPYLRDPSRPRRGRRGTADPTGARRVISPEDRWRLILGGERERLRERALRAGVALDELYGAGRGEGAGSRLDGAGAEPGQLGVREWLDELRDLFGERVAEQVVGRAAEQGRSHVLLNLDPESVTPSVGRLQELLSLKGGLPLERLVRRSRVVERVVRDLVRELTSSLRPALTGGDVARPTRRPGGPLDLSRRVARSLRTVRFGEDGSPQLVPDRLVFRAAPGIAAGQGGWLKAPICDSGITTVRLGPSIAGAARGFAMQIQCPPFRSDRSSSHRACPRCSKRSPRLAVQRHRQKSSSSAVLV
jgi:Family of unknown function (DUF5682)